MAIVKIQAPLAGIRGKYGGMIFSANGSGPYLKQWTYPVSKNTELQVVVRTNLARIRFEWNLLDQATIDDWNIFAAAPPEDDYNSLGELIFLSGSAWHTRINMRRLQAGQAIENIAPASTPVAAPLTFSMVVVDYEDLVNDSKFEYTSGDFTGFYAVLHCSLGAATNKQVQTTGYLSIWCGTVENLTWTRINEEILAAFGPVQEDAKVFGGLYKQSTDGIRSLPLLATTIVV